MTMKSSFDLLGLPLIHVATGQVVDGRYGRGVARGWIAVGDVAFGVLLAVGGLVVGGISIGGLALGGLALARDVALGGLAVATHANDAIAQELATRQTFFRVSMGVAKYSRWLLLLAVLPVMMTPRQRRRAESDRGIHD